MNDDISIRSASLADIDDIVEFTHRLYAIKRGKAFYQWLYFHRDIDSMLFGAYHRGRMVGMFGLHRQPVSNGLMSGHVVGINVAPEFIGKGVFTRLCHYAEEHFQGLAMIYIFANDRAVMPCEKALNVRFVDTISTEMATIRNDMPFHANYEISPIGGSTDFANIIAPGKQYFFHYTQQNRTWRFAHHPLYWYTKLSLSSGEYAILKTFTDQATSIEYGDIVDIECPLHDRQMLHRLTTAALSFFKQRGILYVDTWAMPGQTYSEVLHELGFSKNSPRTHFGIRALIPLPERMHTITAWHLKQADATNY